MASPKSYLAEGGVWPLGPFAVDREPRWADMARRQGEFAWLVKAARTKRQWSQEDLAGKAGVDRTVITAFESGQRWSDSESIWAMASALKIDTTPGGFTAEWPGGHPEHPGSQLSHGAGEPPEPDHSAE